MNITASGLDDRLTPSPLLTTDRPPYRLEAATWDVLRGETPLRPFFLELRTTTFITASPGESNELHITADDDGSRVLDLYTRLMASPFAGNRNQRFELSGRDLVEFLCLDPALDIRINQGADLEVRFAATLLRDLEQQLQDERTPLTQQQTTVVGTVRAPQPTATENTGAAQ